MSGTSLAPPPLHPELTHTLDFDFLCCSLTTPAEDVLNTRVGDMQIGCSKNRSGR
eukprot:m.369777 g.369777  ORF g.369777 m.369777 type:complete len:55 (-) comp28125_c1_seq1:6415-6579(-)